MLSVVILTKNEEKNIIDCLETVLWADEIIVLDDCSRDRTLDVIKQLDNPKIKVYEKDLENDFSKQRNYGLTKTTKKWVLFIDADERVGPKLKEEINSIIINQEDSNINGYLVKRKDFMWGKLMKHGETGNISLLRFGKRGSGAWVGKVHEEWRIDGIVKELDNYLLHHPHPSINDFLSEINFYSTLRARELYNQKVRASAISIILYPKAKFFINFIIKLGFLDGVEGLILAIMMSLHSFLVRGKLWLLWQKN